MIRRGAVREARGVCECVSAAPRRTNRRARLVAFPLGACDVSVCVPRARHHFHRGHRRCNGSRPTPAAPPAATPPALRRTRRRSRRGGACRLVRARLPRRGGYRLAVCLPRPAPSIHLRVTRNGQLERPAPSIHLRVTRNGQLERPAPSVLTRRAPSQARRLVRARPGEALGALARRRVRGARALVAETAPQVRAIGVRAEGRAVPPHRL